MNQFDKYENFLPLVTLDLSYKGIRDKIHIIFVCFAHSSRPIDPDFPLGESMGNYTFKIEENNLYKPIFSKNALNIDNKYLNHFELIQIEYSKLKKMNKDILHTITTPNKPEWWQNDQTPLNSIGKEFKFVCQLEMDKIFGDHALMCTYIFYDEHDREVKYIHQLD
ncbi:hypothetical protein [Flavobacterium litorale]|uniref:Uncharacterized protein n=1 Tax=Flavobacterium litorale TaxID=2856519 RepID=A0ABX8V998_9FLAO|nr:hypothetical protein [Flavobacterium litorale]QYJ69092.1 hypothetical protein K1I41_04170 [Flavobacterium litorale]